MSEDISQDLIEGSTQATVVACAFLLRENGFDEAAQFLITAARKNMTSEQYGAALQRARAVSAQAKQSSGADGDFPCP